MHNLEFFITRFPLITITFSVFFFSCTIKSNSNEVAENTKQIAINGKISHPILGYMPNHTSLIDENLINQQKVPDKFKFENYLVNFDYTIGGLNSDFLGEITDLETDSEGHIYILDGRKPALKKYDKNGTLLYTYGAIKGRGPIDLFQPKAIAIDITNNKIFVADQFNEVKVFEFTSDSLRFIETFPTPNIIPTDICILNDELYIRTLSRNKNISDSTVHNLIHVYSALDYEYKRSFGEMYKSPRIQTNMRMSGGIAKLGCIESSNTIIYSFDSSPYLYGYTSLGEFKWITELNPYTKVVSTETVNNGVAVKWEFNYQGTRILNFSYGIEKYIVLSMVTTSKNSSAVYDNFLISSENGAYYNLNYHKWIVNLNQEFVYTKNIQDEISVEAFSIQE